MILKKINCKGKQKRYLMTVSKSEETEKLSISYKACFFQVNNRNI